jgi:hypothetical protein
MTATTIPVIVTAEAAAQVASLGMQRELEQMIEWARQNVPTLKAIRVALGYPRGALNGERPVLIWAHREEAADLSTIHLPDLEWGIWKAQTFPGAVCLRFTLASAFHPLPADGHGG